MAETLQTLDSGYLQQCIHCGMCLPTCPTYDATKRERNSPRGRIAWMKAIASGEAGVTEDFADEMSYCLGCLACETACPAGVQYGVLFESARSTIEQSPDVYRAIPRTVWRAISLHGLFMHPRLLRATGAMLRVVQRSGLDVWARRVGLTKMLPPSIQRLEPQAPRMAAAWSPALIRPVEQPRGARRHRVALLTGCVQDLVLPDVNRATADVLLANGCEVITPPVQPCCGSLHAHNGETDLARTLARRMLDLIPPDSVDAIITNAGGCGSHLRHYTALLHDDPVYGERAHAWDAKVRDIHEWLVEIGFRPPTASPFAEPVTVTYHDSCHLAHGQKVVTQPRLVLRALPGCSVVELPEFNWCCGSAGVYNITQPEQSAKLLERKTRNICGTGAQVVATGNPGCQLQVVRGLAEAGAAVDVAHPVVLLARAYAREGSIS